MPTNLFPQSPHLNRGKWEEFERGVKACMTDGGAEKARLSWTFHYESSSHQRPSNATYAASYTGGTCSSSEQSFSNECAEQHVEEQQAEEPPPKQPQQQAERAEQTPIVEKTSKETAELMAVVSKEQAAADIVKANVEKKAAAAQIESDKAAVIEADVQEDLAKAMPAMAAAPVA